MNLEGIFSHFNYSPKGEPEALMLATSKGLAQINFPSGRASSMADFLKYGEKIKVKADPVEDAFKSEHPVYQLTELRSGSDSVRIHTIIEVKGIVKHFNYTRHGEINGAVLESGDFIHLKPHGAKAVNLTVGHTIRAKGPGYRLTATGPQAVEAVQVNGRGLHHLEHARKAAKKAAAKVAKKAAKKP